MSGYERPDEPRRDFKGVMIPKEVWLDDRLSALDKIILTEIDSLDGDDGCYAKNDYLAKFCHCSESKVSKAISKLTDLGYLYRASFDGRQRILRSTLSHPTEEHQPKVCLVKNARQTSKKCQADSQNLPDLYIDRSSLIENDNEYIAQGSQPVILDTPPKPKRKRSAFTPPTPEMVAEYAESRGVSIDGDHFCDYYASNGWMVGRNKMKDWKAAVRTWIRNAKKWNGDGGDSPDDYSAYEQGWGQTRYV